MATISVTALAPFTAQLVFSDAEVAALQWDAAQQPTPTTAAALFQQRTQSYIDAAVERYKTVQRNALLEKFEKATPDQQAAALAALTPAV
jgi:hypothetical protein